MANQLTNYTSVYNIKDFISKDIAQKYFDLDDINQYNIGVFGYLSDIESSTTEDISNMISTYIKEIFPNLADISESIYSYSGLYDVQNMFATPSSTNIILFVNEADILRNGQRNGTQYEFFIDSNLVIDIDGHEFSPDYDIKISYRQYRESYIYNCMYDIDYENSLSNVTTRPYIQMKKIKYMNENYLGLMITVRAAKRETQVFNIINNDKINVPKVTVDFEGQLAGFEVLYKSPTSTVFRQIKKVFYMAAPIKTDFCFFKMVNENRLELSFTTKDGYFQPAFNSEIKVIIYTCEGASDNFTLYKGDNITVSQTSEKYPYNDNLLLLAVERSDSIGGSPMKTIDGLKSEYLQNMLTLKSYTTENDLQIFFNQLKTYLGGDIVFIKKRDDVFERLFGAFSLFKDYNNDIYPTNTLNLLIQKDQLYDPGEAYIIKPGQVFSYDGNSTDRVIMIDNKDRALSDEEFLYTNPFLIYIQKSPDVVGYFINSCNESFQTDFIFSEEQAPVQFICSSIDIFRDAINGDNEYTVTISVSPSVDNYPDIVDEDGNDTGVLKVCGTLSKGGIEDFMVNFALKSADVDSNVYTYETKLKTADRITLQNEIELIDMIDTSDGSLITASTPMYMDLKILTLFKFDDVNIGHRFDAINNLNGYTLTNEYRSSESIKLITPIANMRSKLTYEGNPDNDIFSILISLSPLVKYDLIKDTKRYLYLLSSMKKQYIFLAELMHQIVNNYTIDLKFYNTYGRSNNFMIGDGAEKLNKVNIDISFAVSPAIGTDEDKLKDDMRVIIKEYIESINKDSLNAIYISNLITKLETALPEIEYLKFTSINNYDSSVQVIDNSGVNLELFDRSQIRNFVPEFLTVELQNIKITTIEGRQKTI